MNFSIHSKFQRSLTAQNRKRVEKLGLAVTDQLLFSGSNFIVSILLARWMSYDTYGTFSFTYSVFMLLASVHNSLLLEPYTVIGSSEHRFHLKTYAHRNAQLNLLWTAAVSGVSLVVAAAAFLAGHQMLGESLVGLSLAQGAILYFWYVRRKWYVNQKIGRYLIGTTVYLIAQLAFVWGLQQAALLTPLTAFLGVAAAALLASAAARLSSEESDVEPEPVNLRNIIKENWTYGKWVLLASVLFWLTGQGYNVLTGSLLTLSDTAGLKALQNLVNPIIQVLAAFNLVFLPWISRHHAENGLGASNKYFLLYAFFVTLAALAYWIFLVVFSAPVFDLLYRGQYKEYIYLLPILAVIPIVSALSASWALGLRVLRQTRLLFWVDSVGAVFTITFGVLLVSQYGLGGAVVGSAVSSVSRLPVLAFLWRRATRENIPQSPKEIA